MKVQLSAQAREARRLHFLGPKPTPRHLAAFEQLEVVLAEVPSIFAQASGDDLEINVLDVIGYDWWTGGGVTAKGIKRVLDEHSNAKKIRCVINSPGGLAFEGISIFNILRRHHAKITTEVVGLAASAASVIFMAGERREMHVGTDVMVHRALGFTVGNVDDHEEHIKVLKNLDQRLIDIYVDRGNMEEERARELVVAETWMGPDEAITEGFATHIIRTQPKRAPVESETPENDNPDDTTEETEEAEEAAIKPPDAPVIRQPHNTAPVRPRVPSPLAELTCS